MQKSAEERRLERSAAAAAKAEQVAKAVAAKAAFDALPEWAKFARDVSYARYEMDWAQKRMDEALVEVVRFMRAKADDIERDAKSEYCADDQVRKIGNVQHTVLWMLANLNLDDLPGKAAAADKARAEYVKMAEKLSEMLVAASVAKTVDEVLAERQ